MIIHSEKINFRLYNGNELIMTPIYIGIVDKKCEYKDRINNKRTSTLSIFVSFIDIKYITNFRKDNKNLYFITESKYLENKENIGYKEYLKKILKHYISRVKINDSNALVQVNYIINTEKKIFKISLKTKSGKYLAEIKHYNLYNNKEEDIYNKKEFVELWKLLEKNKA